MARRRRSSTAEDVVDLVAMMPWYVGIVLAVVSYLFFGSLAASTATGNPTTVVWHLLGLIGRMVVPILCLVGAALSAYRRHERRSLVDQVAVSNDVGSLNAMSWRQFEKLVGEGFRLQGYTVIENEGAGPDDGVDLVLRKNGDKYLVQCKQWRAVKVGVSVVRELYGAMHALGATGGIVVTSGRFTPEARAFAQGRNLQLVDGPELHRLLREARDRAPAPAPGEADSPWYQEKPHPAPACPMCSRTMVRRVAKKGISAGAAFWGCPDFPRCRGTRNS